MSHSARKLLEQKKFDPLIATLSDRLGTDNTAALWMRAEQRLDGLLKTTDELSKEEKAHVEGYIMPTFALYREMSEEMGRDEALALLMDFAHTNALVNRRFFERMVSIPGGKGLFLRGFAIMQPRAFGESAGFAVRSTSNDGTHAHLDIVGCPYQRVTAELGAPELCNLFCTNDDIIYGDLPGIRFSRTGTLGRGDAVCDFDVSLAEGTAVEPRKLLVVGVGVIGSYLTQVLCEAGHDVYVVARGRWADTIERDGLRIRHYLQRKDTTCRPRVVRELPTGEHFDATFVVMRQDQMVALAPELATLDTDLVVCVGNDLRTDEVETAIRADGAGPERVLFGFQGTAGHREADRAVVVRLGAWHLTVGSLAGEVSERDRALLESIFCGSYRANFQHDMRWWLVCHAVSVLPFCFLAYRLDCDLTKATAADITALTDAMLEGYRAVLAAGGMILPEGDEDFLKPGPKRIAWEIGLRVMAKTAIGRLCVTDHCKNAVSEMRVLDEGVAELFAQVPDVAHPAWDALRTAMPTWDELERVWQS
ncbi:MAG: L-2-amino-thiazoline-4-carboxylic acid hydrolase [Atopobiaceae bacterium]|nr:L-2-amino-thiazoline-4-carboxylic acid hydrolase [Atopobiaceae bacterium]